MQYFGTGLGAGACTMFTVGDDCVRCTETGVCSVLIACRPSSHKIRPLSDLRDMLPEGRQIYALELTYTFHVVKAEEVMPDCSLLSNLLYENEYESQLWMIFDANKQVMCSGDAYPHQYNVKLEKGEYTILLQVRHEKRESLERLRDLVMLLYRKLPASLSLDVYGSWSNALSAGKKMTSASLGKGTVTPLFLGTLPDDKVPKGTSAGWFLSGSITLAKEDPTKKASSVPFTYVLTENPQKSNAAKNIKGKKEEKATKEKEKTKEEEYADALRDLKITWLSKLPIENSLYEELRQQHPDHIPVMIARLQALDADKDRDKYLQDIVALSQQVLKEVDHDAMLLYFGIKSDQRSDAATIKSDMEKKKTWVIEALVKLGCAQADLLSKGENSGSGEATMQDLDNTLVEVQKFADLTDVKVLPFSVKHAMVRKHFGRAVKFLQKQLEEKATSATDLKLLEAFNKLRWYHCAHYQEHSMPVKYPTAYRPF